MSSEIPDLSPNADPPAPLQRRESIEKHLQTRPNAQELKDRGILLDTNAAPLTDTILAAPLPEGKVKVSCSGNSSLQAKAHELERQRASDSLRKGLETRPERSELVERNILPDSSVAPGIQGHQKDLQRSMRRDSLEQKLAKRPKPEELVKEGILQADEDPSKE